MSDVAVTSGERLLYTMVQGCPHHDSWNTKRQLQESAGISTRTLNRRLYILVAAGYLEERASINEVHGGLNPTYYRLSC